MPRLGAEDTPQDDHRPNYRSLNTNFPVMVATPQEPEEEEKAASKVPGGGIIPIVFGLFQQVFSLQFAGPSPNDPLSPLYAAPRIHAPSVPTVFTVSKDQTFLFAEEITGTIPGVTNEDSYLFLTSNTGESLNGDLRPQWRAFVVSKADPTKQHEIAVTDVKSGPTNYGFDVTLNGGHKLSLSHSNSLDGIRIRGLENPEIDKLVKSPVEGSSTDDGYHSRFSGDSWVILKKDFATGRIERYTQDGKSNLGRYEVIQGDPCTPEQLDKDRYLSARWVYNGETERAPQSSSVKLVPLPDSMKWDIVEDIQHNNYQINMYEGGVQTRANEALNGLMPDQADRLEVIAGVRQRSKAIASALNATENQGERNQILKKWPQPF